ncbi:hypothetical protein PTKIN_Ptkin02bG0226300 [Pterospermum kingtungense]
MEFPNVYGNLRDYLSVSSLSLKSLLLNRRIDKVPNRTKHYRQTNSNGYWKEVPSEIMEIIVQRLSVSDRIRMSTVSKYWGAIASQKHIPTTPQFPWLTLPHDDHRNNKELSFYDMSAGKVQKLKLPKRLQGTVCCGSSKGWLIMADDASYRNFLFPSSKNESDIFLFNPISREVHQLPPLTTIPGYQQFLKEKIHNISCFVKKIELSSANVSECVVAGVFKSCCFPMAEVAICRPGNKQWSIFTGKTEDDNFAFSNFLICKSTLYLLAMVEHVENYNLDLGAGFEMNIKIIPGSYIEEGDQDEVMADDFVLLSEGAFRLYLVESTSNEILLIKRVYDLFIERINEDDDHIEDDHILDYNKTSSFYVFKMDPSTSEWHRLDNIDDQVFFISFGGSASVSAKDFEGVRGNCIYFAEDYDYCGDNPCPISRDCGVFYLEDGRIERPFPSVSLPLRSRMCWFTPIL